jgi:hypothetical protein
LRLHWHADFFPQLRARHSQPFMALIWLLSDQYRSTITVAMRAEWRDFVLSSGWIRSKSLSFKGCFAMSAASKIAMHRPRSAQAPESSESAGLMAHSTGQICENGIIGTDAAKASVLDREVGHAERACIEDWLAKYPAASGSNSQGEGAAPSPQDAQPQSAADGLRIVSKNLPLRTDAFEWGTWMCAPSLRRLKNPPPFSGLQTSLIVCATAVPIAYITFFKSPAPTIDVEAAGATALFNAPSEVPEPLPTGLLSARTPADAPAARDGVRETSTSKLDLAVAAAEPQVAVQRAKSAPLSPETSLSNGAQTVAAGNEAEPRGQAPSNQSARLSDSEVDVTEVTSTDLQRAPAVTSLTAGSSAVAVKSNTATDMLAALSEAPARRDANAIARAQDTQPLIERGRQLLEAGDVIAARLLFNRASNAGDAAAAAAMGTTYDPAVLRAHGLSGSLGDSEKARNWYEVAHKLGLPEKPHPSELNMAPARAEESGRRNTSRRPSAPTPRLIHSPSGARP